MKAKAKVDHPKPPKPVKGVLTVEGFWAYDDRDFEHWVQLDMPIRFMLGDILTITTYK